MNIAICDDDGIFADKSEKIVRSVMTGLGAETKIDLFYSGKEFLTESRKHSFDIILMDIDMPRQTGFSTIEEVYKNHPDVNVIFVTSHEELAYQAYDYHPYQFVQKNDLDKLPRVLKALYKKIAAKSLSSDIVHLTEIPDVNLNEVMYIKSERNYVLAVNSNKSVTKHRGKIKNVYMQLKEYGFIYPQRSYVVNCRYINDFDRKEITLKNGEIVSVSRDDEVRREAQYLYGKYMRSVRW